MERKTLVLIDGNSLLYRAFFALPALSAPDGTPTNAVHGLADMLLRLLDEERPDVVLVAQEGGRTFRHEAFGDYKAQRPAAPDDLVRQTQLARELMEAFRIPIVAHPGYEADDVIGTLACAGERAGYEVRIVTGDLDALQLVDDHVRVITNRRGMTDTVVYDVAAVKERFGLEPSQLPDYKALKGDSSDNIPGVPGIGDKTAARLLADHGSLEHLLEDAETLPEGRVRTALLAARDEALMYRRLATIVTDLPLETPFDAWAYPGPDLPRVRDLFARLGFRRLSARLPLDGAAPVAPVTQPADFRIRTLSEGPDLARVVEAARAADSVALRTIVDQRERHGGRLTGLALSLGGGEAVLLGGQPADDPLGILGTEEPYRLPETVRDLLADPAVGVMGHDLKADLHTLWRAGVPRVALAFDTLLAAYVLNPGRSAYRLADLATEHLGVRRAPDAPADPGWEAAAIALLRPVLAARLEAEGVAELYRDVEVPLIGILARMEAVGVAVDEARLRELSAELARDVATVEAEVYRLAGHPFNIGSPKQLQEVLFTELGLTPGKRTKTGLSTGVEVLEELAESHPIVRRILEYRELTKLKSTYADALPRLIDPATGRIHTSLNQTVAATGRLSSSEPNLQNIPIRTEIGRKIRQAFVPARGCRLLSADYSQIELRILAHVTGDPELVRAFAAEEDIHTHTAARLFEVPEEAVTQEMRRRAKTINFAVIYGMSDFGLSRELGIPVAAAREMIAAYGERFPGVRRYAEATVAQARRDGYVSTLLGRRRYLPDIRSANRNFRLFAERTAVNTPIQGTAADIIKRAMIGVDAALRAQRLASRMILQVHDELLFEGPPEEIGALAALARREMEGAFPLKVPLRVEVKAGENWRDLVPVPSSP
jgi:DNA polymerase-1